jgi:predicted transcriptional regulator
VDLSSQRHPVGRRLRKAGAEGCTVAQLTEASGLTQQAVALWLKAREQDGQCERFAKRGNADVWRWSGTAQEQEAASG